MGFLQARDLCAISGADRRCRELASDPVLWRRLSRTRKHPRAPSGIHHKEWYGRMEARVILRVCFVRDRDNKGRQQNLLRRIGKWMDVPVERDVSLHQLTHAVAAQCCSAPRLVRLWKPCVVDDGSRAVLVPLEVEDKKAPDILSACGLELVCSALSPGHEEQMGDVCRVHKTTLAAWPL
ncbi:F-box domain-containing protein [Acanthamoeba castellanii medusavirus]|uniref:F-box domain-containing protein n=1 Tax=Acanthamoeba castellanii medusavirus J1 TaxID=3114988 RepID=A0A3T1CXP0_9VIRU|nr:F-box domain-containing protein [Acanthamoeba castellanii medusavirus]BBI30593.1 F-box domain-containing protein [Acanthamoeba castellanii medusavirus J1]